MRFRKSNYKYRRRFTPRSRHNYNRRCRPSVLIMRVDATKANYLKKPNPHAKNG